MIFRVSASCYRRLFATVLVALLSAVLAKQHMFADSLVMMQKMSSQLWWCRYAVVVGRVAEFALFTRVL